MLKFNRTAFQSYVNKIHRITETQCVTHPVQFGYPMNVHELAALDDVRRAMQPFYVLNNCGDPFNHHKAHWQMHSLTQEKELINKCGTSWGIPYDNTERKIWGYCTTGGTEGNSAGIRRGMATFKHRRPLLIHCSEAHYSIPKASNGLGAQSAIVDPLPNGEMDLDDLG
jgi:glutamate/tyrosine decarboxylase-like PLP-dependent enzyme